MLDATITPEELLTIPTDELCAILKKASRGRFGEAKAEEIRTAAQNSFGITIATSAFAMQLRQLLEMIDLLERQLDELDFEIEQRMNKLDTCITTCPGVGKVLGGIILGEIGDIPRFSEPKKLVAFVGIDPSIHQSGEFNGTKNRRIRSPSEARLICVGPSGWPLMWRPFMTRFFPLSTRRSEQRGSTTILRWGLLHEN